MNFTQFNNDLKKYQPEEIVFVGLGNEQRGDDAAGLFFVDRLQNRPEFKNAHFLQAGVSPENYLQQILSFRAGIIVFIDASRWGGAPGEIAWLTTNIIERVGISTHAFSITMVEDYLKAHQQLEFKYLGIEPMSTVFGEGLSKQVKNSLEKFFG